jgi:16S rRNA (guanine1207-N2)-methyltransferase
MSVLPNSHQALLKNLDRLSGRTAFLGLTSPALLDQVDVDGLVMTDHAGIYDLLSARESCTPAFGYDDPALVHASADTIVVFLPKSRTELSLRLALAQWLVAQGGRVILVGEKKEGIAGAVRQLQQQLPQSEKIDSVRHCQVWQAASVTTSEAFRLADWLQWHRVDRQGVTLEVAGLPGIFSEGELDAGTAMLLDTLAETPLMQGRVLDFACGSGVIGAWWQRFQADNADTLSPVDGVDVQFQAVTCARATYRRASVEGRILASDGLAVVEGQYQSVVTNPPFHTGVRTDSSITEQLLQRVSRHLVKGGELRLVANRFLPYEALIRRYIGQPSVLAENNRFVVWSARKA